MIVDLTTHFLPFDFVMEIYAEQFVEAVVEAFLCIKEFAQRRE
jgi:hypothetical protein